MAVMLKNSSSYSGKSGDTHWWDWTAYIECTAPDSLDQIDYVEYHLHSSFRNPVRRVHSREGGFALSTRGWGTFELRARVVFKDKKKPAAIVAHELEFVGAS